MMPDARVRLNLGAWSSRCAFEQVEDIGAGYRHSLELLQGCCQVEVDDIKVGRLVCESIIIVLRPMFQSRRGKLSFQV